MFEKLKSCVTLKCIYIILCQSFQNLNFMAEAKFIEV